METIRIQNKGTNEIFNQLDRFVLDAQKRYKILENLTWCDMECILKGKDGTVYLLDECGNWAYFPDKCYEILEG